MNLAYAQPAAVTRRYDNGLGESVHCFGAGLVGVLHRPRTDAHACRGKPAVILFNAGLASRVGPYRIYVQLARALAVAGYTVLRFDQSGLGDSPVASAAPGDRRLREARAAMTLIGAETGIMRFVLGGLCSGADDAFRIAGEDKRVVGAILLDGLGYTTRGFWIRHALPRLVDPRRWPSIMKKLGSSGPGLLDYRDFPGRDEAGRQLTELVRRDVRLLCIYTSGSYYYFNHVGQFAAALGPAGRAPQVKVELWRECDHTFYVRADRERLSRGVLDWIQAAFPGTPPEGSP